MANPNRCGSGEAFPGGGDAAGVGRPPVVSVIMPVFNAALYLEEAVGSVRAQTYPHWELLLCDDGSTDGSVDIARRYAEQDPIRIRALAHRGADNLGASAARNSGLRHASGQFVAMLDADDKWLPHKLEEQVALLARWPSAGALVGATRYWHSWTGRPEDAGRDWTPATGFPSPSLVHPPRLLTATLRREAAVPCTCSMILRHDVVREVGGFEETFKRVYTDQAFYAKVFVSTPILVVDTCWDLYRQNPASATVTEARAGTLRTARMRYLLWLRTYLREQNVGDPVLRAALRHALWSERLSRAVRLAKQTGRIARRLRHALHRAWAAARARRPAPR